MGLNEFNRDSLSNYKKTAAQFGVAKGLPEQAESVDNLIMESMH